MRTHHGDFKTPRLYVCEDHACTGISGAVCMIAGTKTRGLVIDKTLYVSSTNYITRYERGRVERQHHSGLKSSPQTDITDIPPYTV